MNNERIDVLAVMDEAISVMYRDSYSAIPDDLSKARAAVAELIEAAPNLSDYLDGYVMWQRKQGRDPVGLEIAENDIARFRAALARVGGGA